METRFLLLKNGIVLSSDAPPVGAFLERHQGAYTALRTHDSGSCLMFWERHMRRLSQSVGILADSRPDLFPLKSKVESSWDLIVQPLLDVSMQNGLKASLNKRNEREELSITALVCGRSNEQIQEDVDQPCSVYLHIGAFIPSTFGTRDSGAELVIAGRGRELAMSKFSEWVRTRKSLEKWRDSPRTEFLLTNDGDKILEGSKTNFFVVCRKEMTENMDEGVPLCHCSYEVQSAPLSEGVLPGIIRQLVFEVCSRKGIPIREVAPSWSNREDWVEAFVTNSLRVIQHVETIKAPSSWEALQAESSAEVLWEEKRFDGPGNVITSIQREIMEIARFEGVPVSRYLN